MAYTPSTWETGDVIDAAGLNKMEDGIAAAGPLAVTVVPGTGTLDHTWQAIHDALAAKRLVTLWGTDEGESLYAGYILYAYAADGAYVVNALSTTAESYNYSTDAADGYPALDGGEA